MKAIDLQFLKWMTRHEGDEGPIPGRFLRGAMQRCVKSWLARIVKTDDCPDGAIELTRKGKQLVKGVA